MSGTALNCSECSSVHSTVIDSRAEAQYIRRRRACPACKSRWTTYEISEEAFLSLRALSNTRDHLLMAQRNFNSAVDAMSEWIPENSITASGSTVRKEVAA